jgi:hypothetical protein
MLACLPVEAYWLPFCNNIDRRNIDTLIFYIGMVHGLIVDCVTLQQQQQQQQHDFSKAA